VTSSGESASEILPAVQSYVIAWAERERAQAALCAAQRQLEHDLPLARQAMRDAGLGHGCTMDVELLGGDRFKVFRDDAGIVVLPQ
jgi:hypothetical protein